MVTLENTNGPIRTTYRKEGIRKGKVHALFDAQGPEAAWVLGKKLKLAESSLRSWFRVWRRSTPKFKTEAKPKATKQMASV